MVVCGRENGREREGETGKVTQVAYRVWLDYIPV